MASIVIMKADENYIKVDRFLFAARFSSIE